MTGTPFHREHAAKMLPIDSSDPRPVHFVGIAGAGMRALAELLARRGVVVTGCDANPGSTTDLEALGIQVTKGHSADHVAGVRELVVTSAMRKDHPELVRARELGVPITRRAEALGRAVDSGRLVGIAGTHGKTTTTVMTTSALASAGLKPTGIAGGRVAEWNGNLSYESDDLFVVEADEYDRSFLSLWPTVAVVTNIEADHLDIYHDLDDIKTTFAHFVVNAPVIVVCADDAGASSLALPLSSEVIRYGLTSPHAHCRRRHACIRVPRHQRAGTPGALERAIQHNTNRHDRVRWERPMEFIERKDDGPESISIARCRELLGDEADSMTDQEMALMRRHAEMMAWIVVEMCQDHGHISGEEGGGERGDCDRRTSCEGHPRQTEPSGRGVPLRAFDRHRDLRPPRRETARGAHARPEGPSLRPAR